MAQALRFVTTYPGWNAFNERGRATGRRRRLAPKTGPREGQSIPPVQPRPPDLQKVCYAPVC